MDDVIEAKRLGFPALNEASLGRVYQHIKSGESFAILTSWRQDLTPAENKANFKALQSALRGANLGFSKLLGHWKEEGQEEASAEPSLFVKGITKRLANKLGNRYNQDAILYAGPDTDGKVVLVFKNGSEITIGKFHPGKIAQAYSSVRGKTFTFEGFEYPAQSHVEMLIARLRS